MGQMLALIVIDGEGPEPGPTVEASFICLFIRLFIGLLHKKGSEKVEGRTV